MATFYLSFRVTKEPFNDVSVRRAFSAAFDRQTFIDEFRAENGLPAIHFAPPGIFGAPPVDETGIGFDPEFAREQLAAAGYPNCQGFPTITVLGYTGQSTLDWLEFSRDQWVENLGCAADRIQIEQQTFAELLASTVQTNPDSETPHIWTLGWGPDYPDENNWVGDVLWCESGQNRTNRSCTTTDLLIEEARETTDQNARIELYHQIENRFFGPSGEVPFIPIFHRTYALAVHDWLVWEPLLFGGEYWYDWQLDAVEKSAASN
jgi:oligopeptide transport system substrate-binding protein